MKKGVWGEASQKIVWIFALRNMIFHAEKLIPRCQLLRNFLKFFMIKKLIFVVLSFVQDLLDGTMRNPEICRKMKISAKWRTQKHVFLGAPWGRIIFISVPASEASRKPKRYVTCKKCFPYGSLSLKICKNMQKYAEK